MTKMSSRKLILIVFCLAVAGCDKSNTVSSGAPAGGTLVGLQSISLIAWNADAEGVVVTSNAGVVTVEGNDTRLGYQVSTPPQTIVPNTDATVNVKMRIASGRVCVGVLNETRQSWIVAPGDAAAGVHFNSGANKLVHVVVANCNEAESNNPKSQFSIEKADLSFSQKS